MPHWLFVILNHISNWHKDASRLVIFNLYITEVFFNLLHHATACHKKKKHTVRFSLARQAVRWPTPQSSALYHQQWHIQLNRGLYIQMFSPDYESANCFQFLPPRFDIKIIKIRVSIFSTWTRAQLRFFLSTLFSVDICVLHTQVSGKEEESCRLAFYFINSKSGLKALLKWMQWRPDEQR